MTHTLGLVAGPVGGKWQWCHLNGVDISKHVSRVEIDVKAANEPPLVRLTLSPHRIVFSGSGKAPFELDLDASAQVALVQAGWTPPEVAE